MLTPKQTQELVLMSKDIITHPIQDSPQENDYLSSIFESEIFTKAEIEDINNALKILVNSERLSSSTKVNYMNNLWKVNYTTKPPSVNEFLNDWLGEGSQDIFPHIKDAFNEFFDPTSLKRHLCLAYPIGSGKSTLASLINIYLSISIYYMRDYKKFLKMGKSSVLASVILSFTKEKAHDLIVKPILETMAYSEKFHRVRTEHDLVEKLKLKDPNTVYYTTAGEGSVLRIGNLRFKHLSRVQSLLGLSIICGTITEISFFTQQGMSQEQIWNFYYKLKSRIKSRFGDNYLARTILDSSPDDMSNKIDNYVFNEAHKDPKVLRLIGNKWTLQPDHDAFVEWRKTGETFPVYKGTASKLPKMLDASEVVNFVPEDIINVPIDLKAMCAENLIETLKDWAGHPSGSSDKLISNQDIIESIFTSHLRNFYSFEHAPASLPPEGLLWDIVKKKFFVYSGKGSLYNFYRYPNAPRFVSIDLAKRKDMATISMCHLERNIRGEKIYVFDFTLPVMSTKEEINMDAFKFLVHDMVKFGGINIKMVSYDGYQSETSKQFLNRHEIDTIYLSMDRTLDPYMTFISYMSQSNSRIKVGKNLISKNNFKSLILQKIDGKKMKVEHEQGDWIDLENMDWEKSRMGYFGKDLSDSMVGCVTLADLYGTDNADFIWNEQAELDKIAIGTEKNIELDIKKKYNLKFGSSYSQNGSPITI